MLKSDAKLVTKKNRIRPKNSEVTRLLGNNKKMKRSFKWKTKYSFEDGLKKQLNGIQMKEIYHFSKNLIIRYNIKECVQLL